MKFRVFTALAIAVLALNFAGSTLADGSKKKAAGPDLVAMLPASHGVVSIDVRRLLNEGLPTILSSKPDWVAKLNESIDDIRGKTGLDLRMFEQAAIGVNTTDLGNGKFDIDPVILARGDFNAGSLIAIAKVASDGKYREETVGTHSLIIFSVKDAADKAAAKAAAANSTANSIMDSVEDSFSEEVAVTALTDNTLAIGTAARVRETIAGKTKISPELNAMLAKYPNTIAKMAATVPGGLSKFVPMENDEIGKNIDGIRSISGAFNVTPVQSTFMMSAKTLQPSQAKSLYETLDGLMAVGANFLGNSKRDDQRLYAKLLRNAKVTQKGSTVDLALAVDQPDIDTLTGMLKFKSKTEGEPKTGD